jgi:hypothetical protein
MCLQQFGSVLSVKEFPCMMEDEELGWSVMTGTESRCVFGGALSSMRNGVMREDQGSVMAEPEVWR